MFKEKLRERIVQRIVKLHKIPINPFVKQVIQIDENVFVPEEDADVADKIAEIFKSVYSLGDQQRSAVYSAVLCGLRNHGEGMSFVQMVEELESIGTSYAKSVISKIRTIICLPGMRHLTGRIYGIRKERFILFRWQAMDGKYRYYLQRFYCGISGVFV